MKHYAGDVEYSVDGWIEKNKDPLNEDITRLLARSSQKHVAYLFEDYLSDQDDKLTTSTMTRPSSASSTNSALSSASMLKMRKGSGSFRTGGQRHKQQLLSLMNTLYMTHPHFVRCILPNNRKYAGEIQTKLVLDQLRCNGVLEGIRICRKGFPNRLSFNEFRKRYGVLYPEILDPHAFIDGRTACQMLIRQIGLEPERYQIGITKVFFKATVLATLEEQRDNKLGACITQFQAVCRGRLMRQYQTRFSRQTDAIRIMQHNARKYILLREWSWWKMYAKLKPLNHAYRVDIQIRDKEQKIRELETEVRQQQSVVDELTTRNRELENENQDFKELVMEEQTIIQELQESKDDLVHQCSALEERLEELELELQQRSEQAEQEAIVHTQEMEELQEQMEEIKTVHEAIVVELEQSCVTIKEMDHQLQEIHTEKSQLKAQLTTVQTEVVRCLDRLGGLEDQISQQDQTILQLETIQREQEASLEDKDREIEQLKMALEAHEEAESEQEASLEDKDREIEQLKKALETHEETESKLASEREQKTEWISKYEQLKADWDDLTALLRAESDQAKSRISR